MAETLSNVHTYRDGRMRSMSADVTPSGTSGDINTGFQRVVEAGFCGVASPDTDISVARNSTTTTDESRNAMGTVHFGGANAATKYRFRARGF